MEIVKFEVMKSEGNVVLTEAPSSKVTPWRGKLVKEEKAKGRREGRKRSTMPHAVVVKLLPAEYVKLFVLSSSVNVPEKGKYKNGGLAAL